MIEYRQFERGDLEQCRALNLVCVEDLSGMSSAARQWLRQKILAPSYGDELARIHCVVAVDNGRVIGMGALDGSSVKRMYVSPGYRGRRTGTAIYEHLEAEARRRALELLALESSLNAVGFYERLGFSRVREVTSYLDDLPVVNVLMTKRLEREASGGS